MGYIIYSLHNNTPVDFVFDQEDRDAASEYAY
jgi:hypothetical protein